MEKLNITPLNIETDIPKIKQWEEKYKNDNRFNDIKHFILEDNTYYGLDEVILTNYEFFHIGEDEKKFCFSIKNKNNEIAGFVLACLFNISINKPELILQYIVLNPDYQNEGYGTMVLNELISNPQKYFNLSPTEVYANIQKENNASLNLFKKFGFSFTSAPMGYLRAHKSIKELLNEKI